MNFLQEAFVQKALLAGCIVGAVAPLIGTFLVQRRLSLVGDGIGHIAFAGVAIGLWLGVSPLLAALVAAVAGALGIERFRRRDPDSADMALALFFYASIAVAIVVSSKTGSLNGTSLIGVLFGQVLTVTGNEVLAIAVIGLLVVAAVGALYKGLVTSAIDEEGAIVSGLPVVALNAGLMVLASLTIGLGMRVVGILLVAALMVIPVGAARNVMRSFRATLIVASAIGAASAAAGIIISTYASTAPSGTIVLVATAAYFASDLIRIARERAVRRQAVSR